MEQDIYFRVHFLVVPKDLTEIIGDSVHGNYFNARLKALPEIGDELCLNKTVYKVVGTFMGEIVKKEGMAYPDLQDVKIRVLKKCE